MIIEELRKINDLFLVDKLKEINMKFNPNHVASGENGGQFTSGGGREMIDADEERKKELKIPPAWKNVKVNTNKEADLIATGIDEKGRTQYIYSENATMRAAEIKFARNKDLIDKQDYIVKQNSENMFSKDVSISEPAHVMSLIHSTGIRPGSLKETGAKVQAFGATTLQGRHILVNGENVRLNFVGKKGVNIDIPVQDKNVAKMLIERKKISGDSGKLFKATDSDLRNYTKKLNGGGFKPKDFRTLKGTSTALQEVKGMKRFTNMNAYKKAVMGVAKKVSKILGNTPSIALKSYINPFVFTHLKPI